MTGQGLVTVRPGPVLHVWQHGQEVARVPLDFHGALTLTSDLLAATARAQAGGHPKSMGNPKRGPAHDLSCDKPRPR
jgi:hypothetical protein